MGTLFERLVVMLLITILYHVIRLRGDDVGHFFFDVGIIFGFTIFQAWLNERRARLSSMKESH